MHLLQTENGVNCTESYDMESWKEQVQLKGFVASADKVQRGRVEPTHSTARNQEAGRDKHLALPRGLGHATRRWELHGGLLLLRRLRKALHLRSKA